MREIVDMRVATMSSTTMRKTFFFLLRFPFTTEGQKHPQENEKFGFYELAHSTQMTG